jgi:hypothetical protein
MKTSKDRDHLYFQCLGNPLFKQAFDDGFRIEERQLMDTQVS